MVTRFSSILVCDLTCFGGKGCLSRYRYALLLGLETGRSKSKPTCSIRIGGISRFRKDLVGGWTSLIVECRVCLMVLLDEREK